jgi:hypothetical protein
VLSAANRFPRHESIQEDLAHLLARHGQVEQALDFARRCDSPWAASFIFKLLVRQGRRAETPPLEAAVAAQRPADPDLFESRIKRNHGDPGRRLLLCEELLDHDPGAAHALYHKAVALAQLGRDEEACALMGLDRLLSIISLPLPPGFVDQQTFREKVRGEILANPDLIEDPAGHATRSGLRTRTFPAVGDRASPALIETIRTAICDYSETLALDHPFVRAKPKVATMTQWALWFRDAGHQVPHHHPGAWLTGVYYVSARSDAARSKARHPGKIRIGALPEWASIEPPWPLLEIEPVPGTLLLFPSFVPHETLPPGEAAERISVAFDVSRAQFREAESPLGSAGRREREAP